MKIKKTKLLIIVMVVLLVFTGSAYAMWTEQVYIGANIKTAYTGLEIYDYSTSGSIVSTGTNNAVTVSVNNIEPQGQASATIAFKNTGTIPIDIDYLKISDICGYSEKYESKLNVSISMYVGNKKVYNKTKKISYWEENSKIVKGNQLAEIPVGGTFKIVTQVKFNNVESKDEETILENIQFKIRPYYTRFNID